MYKSKPTATGGNAINVFTKIIIKGLPKNLLIDSIEAIGIEIKKDTMIAVIDTCRETSIIYKYSEFKL